MLYKNTYQKAAFHVNKKGGECMSGLIGIDWGTTHFRAYFITPDGTIQQKIETDAGILSCKNGNFEEVLQQQLLLFKKIEPSMPIIAAGMITSRQGWLETPYVECPAGIQELARELRPLKTSNSGRIWFVPGVKQLLPEPDIMRGEETQLAGIDLEINRTCLLPGTHSKWVTFENGTIVGFKTFMTGDLFNAVLQKTILGSTETGSWSDEAFRAGVKLGYQRMEKGGGLLSVLFQARVKDILKLQPELDTRSVISGILVGHEIAEGSGCGFQCSEPILVIGNEQLTNLYLLALSTCSLKGEKGPQDVSAQGLYRIAQNKNLV